MWMTKKELNNTRFSDAEIAESYDRVSHVKPRVVFQEPTIKEHKGITIVDGIYLRSLFDGLNEAHTSFLCHNNKFYDIDGGVTGVSLDFKKYCKLKRSGQTETHNSSIVIPFVKDDLELVIEHFLDVFPKEIIDSFENKVFLTCSQIKSSEYDSEYFPCIKIPTSLENEKNFDSYILIDMMVSRVEKD